jgi:pilus assembly protein FimV
MKATQGGLFDPLGDALKRNTRSVGRFALSGVAAAAMYLAVGNAAALGLGRLTVQSALGEQLRAEIDVTSLTPEEEANFRARIAGPDAYRAAGVEYNSALPGAQVTLERRPDGRPYLRIQSERVIQEPFVDVILELSWASGRLVREYTLLLDPPVTRQAAAGLAALGRRRPAAANPPRRRPTRSTNTPCAVATRCMGSPRACSAPASRWTRCWSRCTAPTRMPSSVTT